MLHKARCAPHRVPLKVLLVRMCTSLVLNRRLKKWIKSFFFPFNLIVADRFFFCSTRCAHVLDENADARPVMKVQVNTFLIGGLPPGIKGVHICFTKQACRDGGILFSVICYGLDMLRVGGRVYLALHTFSTGDTKSALQN